FIAVKAPNSSNVSALANVDPTEGGPLVPGGDRSAAHLGGSMRTPVGIQFLSRGGWFTPILAVIATSTLLQHPADAAPPNTWTQAASMITARNGHRANLLLDGTVLVTGGHGSAGTLASAELY